MSGVRRRRSCRSATCSWLAAARAPDNTVLVFPDSRATTAELLVAATVMAQGLHALGVRGGDRVGILMPNCLPFVAALFGVSLLGAVPVLINARYRTEELAYVTANAASASSSPMT